MGLEKRENTGRREEWLIGKGSENEKRNGKRCPVRPERRKNIYRDRGIRLRVGKTAEGRAGQAGQKC
jgi:hypothetical protein